MKNLLVALAMLATFATWGQINSLDFMQRTYNTYRLTTEKGEAPENDYPKNFAALKKTWLAKAKIDFTKDEKLKIENLWKAQWLVLKDAYEIFKETESEARRIELTKVLVKQEEEFRDLLTKEQYGQYVLYGSKHSFLFAGDFYRGFMSNEYLNAYKDKLK